MGEILTSERFAPQRIENPLAPLTRLAMAQIIPSPYGHNAPNVTPLGYYNDARALDFGYLDPQEYRLTIPNLNPDVIERHPFLTQKYEEMEAVDMTPTASRFLDVVYPVNIVTRTPDYQREAAQITDRLLWRFMHRASSEYRDMSPEEQARCTFLRIGGVSLKQTAELCDTTENSVTKVVQMVARRAALDREKLNIIVDVMQQRPKLSLRMLVNNIIQKPN